MSKATTKTNNDPLAIEKKIQLRVNSIKNIDSDEVRVLECFGGEGVLWKKVQERTGRSIVSLSIDTQKYNRFQYKGDSLKVLPNIDLSKFHVIDLDSYGIPFNHCKIILNKYYAGIIHCTVIQSGMGILPSGLLNESGFTRAMIKKARTLLCKKGGDLFKNWLAVRGVRSIEILNLGRKNYFWFDSTQLVENE